MPKPMTTKQAQEIYPEDTESYTCSILCRICKSRVWFYGNLEDQKNNFKCPYCGVEQSNKYLGG
jgi:hypothetical protein